MIYSTTAALAIEPGAAAARAAPRRRRRVRARRRARRRARAAGLWQRAALPALARSALALLVLTLGFGIEANGARRWLACPGFRSRSSPPSSRGSRWCSRSPRRWPPLSPRALASPRLLLRIGPLVAAPVALLLLQPDFGSAVVLCVLAAVLLFAAAAAAAPLRAAGRRDCGRCGALSDAAPVRAGRACSASSTRGGPRTPRASSSCSRSSRSGAAASRRRPRRRAPEALLPARGAHRLHPLGGRRGARAWSACSLVLGAFAALLLAGCASRAARASRFALLAAFGMTALVVVPAVLNAAVVMGLVPTKGLTLPFLSYGGNSLVVYRASRVGILLRHRRSASAARRRPAAPARLRRQRASHERRGRRATPAGRSPAAARGGHVTPALALGRGASRRAATRRSCSARERGLERAARARGRLRAGDAAERGR